MPDPERPSRSRKIRLGAIVAAVILLLSSPLWGRAMLRRMAFFQVRNVEIVGARYLTPTDILTRLRVDTTASVWDDPRPLEERVARHPQVRTVEIGRKLPGTLVVRITENLPVALIPSKEGLRPVDVNGQPLPIDPSRANVDLPIVAGRDSVILALLQRVRITEPAMFDRISEVRRISPTEILVQLTTVPVRMMADVSAERFAEVASVEQDLARRGQRVAELDLRFRDQVIARLQ